MILLFKTVLIMFDIHRPHALSITINIENNAVTNGGFNYLAPEYCIFLFCCQLHLSHNARSR